jgi:hypothetical protein
MNRRKKRCIYMVTEPHIFAQNANQVSMVAMLPGTRKLFKPLLMLDKRFARWFHSLFRRDEFRLKYPEREARKKVESAKEGEEKDKARRELLEAQLRIIEIQEADRSEPSSQLVTDKEIYTRLLAELEEREKYRANLKTIRQEIDALRQDMVERERADREQLAEMERASRERLAEMERADREQLAEMERARREQLAEMERADREAASARRQEIDALRQEVNGISRQLDARLEELRCRRLRELEPTTRRLSLMVAVACVVKQKGLSSATKIAELMVEHDRIMQRNGLSREGLTYRYNLMADRRRHGGPEPDDLEAFNEARDPRIISEDSFVRF